MTIARYEARKTVDERSRVASERSKRRGGAQTDVSLPEPVPHILVVDDDELIREQIERLYVRSGYVVSPVATAEDALERLDARDIDLVVTDIKLPGLSGVELTERIQELYPYVPVVVITGHAGIENAVEVRKFGATDYIVKPFSAATIQESTMRSVREIPRLY